MHLSTGADSYYLNVVFAWLDDLRHFEFRNTFRAAQAAPRAPGSSGAQAIEALGVRVGVDTDVRFWQRIARLRGRALGMLLLKRTVWKRVRAADRRRVWRVLGDSLSC
jgi:hypothetical protein